MKVDALFSNAELLLLSKEVGINKILSHKDKTTIQFDSKLDDRVLNKMLDLIRSNAQLYKMDPSGKLEINMLDVKNSNQRRLFVRNFVNEIS